jgi:hypothetical protein
MLKTSESIDELCKALAKCQGEMGKASKSGFNPHFKSKYANMESVWDACREPLSTNGLCIIQAPNYSEGILTVTTRLSHTSGQWVESPLSIKPTGHTPQAVGSAITYAKRYSLMAIVGIADDDDDDGNQASFKGKSDPRVDPKTLIKLENMLEGRDIQKVSTWIEQTFKVKFENLNQLKQGQAEKIIEVMERKSNDQ